MTFIYASALVGLGGVALAQLYEAEDAERSPAFLVATNNSGYSGSGFVDYVGEGYVEWTVDGGDGGSFTLSFRYALKHGDRPLDILVNGVFASTNTSFPATGSWETWGVVEKEVTLNAGANTVRAQTTGVSGANMDRLDVSAVVTTDRFVDNGDGTVTDTYTGLMWEKKIPDLGAGTGEWSIHEVDKSYYYTAPENSVNAPTGTVFTDFLARLNYSRFAGYTDWRIPSGVEARSLYSGPDPLGQDCIGAPPYECTHPIFGPDRGTWIVTDAMLGYSYPLDTKISLLCPAPCVPHPGGPPLRYVPCKVRCGNCVFALVGRDAAAFGSPFFISTEL